MKIFYCGDIAGKPGREAVFNNIERIREIYRPDVFIANVENSAHGFGVTEKLAREFLAKGVDFMVTGNHAFAQKDIIPFMDASKRIIRPINMGKDAPGKGFGEFETAGGRKILIIQAMGLVFMPTKENYIPSVDALLEKYVPGRTIDAIFVDIHAEATSEKLSFGYYLDGRVSVVAGTHTHVPTADAQLLPKGTAYITDVGMCGNYDSVLGMEKQEPINRLINPHSHGKLRVAEGPGILYGIFVETDDRTGLALRIEQVRM